MAMCKQCGKIVEHTGKKGRPKKDFVCGLCLEVTKQLEPLGVSI